MKELIPKDEYGIFADAHDTARVDSLFVAQVFEKRHDNVLKDIRELDCSSEFRLLNFEESYYRNAQGKKQPSYCMTRDGFVFLAMGYRGKKAAQFKELYIKRFNEMEKFIKSLVSARQEFPLLTENRIVLGMTAKQFRLANNIEKGKSIRPYLTKEQIEMLEILQKVDVGLLVAFPAYEDRKRHLEWYKTKLEEEK